jgi:protein tyrosine phosphatase (PTP) superfamily phosphohydrolase (DUF442 family)
MRHRLLVAALLGCLFAYPATAADLEDIVNYREYSATLSSAGQPGQDAFAAIAEAGFERVVYLAFSDDQTAVPGEDRALENLGIEFVHVPVVWEAPTVSDFRAFAGAMQQEPGRKTLVHCQVNFRASTFSFLYRVLYLGVGIDEAKEDLNSVWVPDATWTAFIFDVLEENDVSPDCDTCLWENAER